MPPSRIAELASLIQSNTAKVDAHFHDHHLPLPSFDEVGPVDFQIQSQEIQDARALAMEASLELYDLLLGPSMCLRPVCIYKYNIPAKVPLGGEISFSDLAASCDLYEPDLRRILRFAMAYHRVFQERTPGFVAHSAASRRLIDFPLAMDGLGAQFDEAYQAFACGWNIAHNTDQPMWEFFASHPDRAKRFAGAMAAYTDGPSVSPALLVKGYSWSSIGNGTGVGTIVDVGGATGSISIELAQSFPGLGFVVQDLPGTVPKSSENVPKDISGRIRFAAHDCFESQPQTADVFLFRMIFHNWSDEHAVKILKATVPGLKRGSRVVINDYLVPEPKTVPLLKERTIREMDMIMLTLFNSRDREMGDWIKLFREADERYQDVKAWVPEGSSLAIIEAVWGG
ncbi:MAG: hypothetical protein Q9214_005058 [Letrouitia sp. 1 TL-2023]